MNLSWCSSFRIRSGDSTVILRWFRGGFAASFPQALPGILLERLTAALKAAHLPGHAWLSHLIQLNYYLFLIDSMKQPYWGLRDSKLRLAIWIEACFGVMTFGYNTGAAGAVLTNLSFNDQFPRMNTVTTEGATKQYNSTIQGTVVAVYTLLGVFGALSCIFLGDLLGRRKTICIAGIVNGIGAILQSTAFTLAQFIVGRVVLGLGTGAILATVSLWQSEVSKAESRGSHVSAFGVFTGSGLALSLWVGFGMSFTQPNSASWRFTLILSLLFSSLLSLFIFTLPESPRWLCKKGRHDEAREVFGLLYNEEPHSEIVTKHIDDIQLTVERTGNASALGMFKSGPQRPLHRVILAMTPQMFLQMSGVNAIAQYTPVIFEQLLHFSAKDSGILAAASQFAVIIGGFLCTWTVDRFGRRKLMLFSASMMSICFACLSALLAHPENKEGIKAGAFFIYFYLFCYVIGFLGIPFLYASEIAMTQFRAQTTGLSTATSWLFNFIVAEVTPVGFANISWKYFLIYCCINAVCVPTIYFFFPETKGRSLEEIDEIFLSSKSIFDTVRVARELPKRRDRTETPVEVKETESGQVVYIDRVDVGKTSEVA